MTDSKTKPTPSRSDPEGQQQREKNIREQVSSNPDHADEDKTPGSGMTHQGGDEAPSG